MNENTRTPLPSTVGPAAVGTDRHSDAVAGAGTTSAASGTPPEVAEPDGAPTAAAAVGGRDGSAGAAGGGGEAAGPASASAADGVTFAASGAESAPRHLDPQRWLDEHGDYLFAFCVRHVRDRDVAEDLVQDTLLAAWSARDGFLGESAERTWLTGILKHKIIDHIRKVQVRTRGAAVMRTTDATPDASSADSGVDARDASGSGSTQQASSATGNPAAGDEGPDPLRRVFTDKGHWTKEVAAWPCDPAQLAEDREFWGVFHQCLDGLPDRAAQAFCLREMSRMPAREIGQTLGTSEANTWQLLHRARVALRECLESNWIRKGDHSA